MPTKQAQAKKVPTQQDLLTALASMSEQDRADFFRQAKDTGIALKATPKAKERTFVAVRKQLVDSSPTAKTQRKAGEVSHMTENSVLATLKTWVRGKDAETLVPLKLASILAGNKETFSTFEIQGLSTPIVESK